MPIRIIFLRKYYFTDKIKTKIKKKTNLSNNNNETIVNKKHDFGAIKENLNQNLSENTSKINLMKDSSKKENFIIKILDNSNSKKYILINSGFIFFYSSYLLATGYLSDYPLEMKNSMRNLGFFFLTIFTSIVFISNRNVRSITFDRGTKEAAIKTFKYLGFSNKNEFIISPLKDVRNISPLNKYIPFFNYGFYVIKLRKQQYKFFNYLIFRPLENFNTVEFEKAFNITLKKSY